MRNNWLVIGPSGVVLIQVLLRYSKVCRSCGPTYQILALQSTYSEFLPKLGVHFLHNMGSFVLADYNWQRFALYDFKAFFTLASTLIGHYNVIIEPFFLLFCLNFLLFVSHLNISSRLGSCVTLSSRNKLWNLLNRLGYSILEIQESLEGLHLRN